MNRKDEEANANTWYREETVNLWLGETDEENRTTWNRETKPTSSVKGKKASFR